MEERPRILIVDADPCIRSLFRTDLSQDGFDIEESECWRTTFECITLFNPRVVLLDDNIPNIPGNRLIRAIKGWRPEIEIIIVSAMVSDELKARCLYDGAFDVMEKPVDMDALKARIWVACGRARARSFVS